MITSYRDIVFWLREMRVTYWITNACLRSIIARALLRYAYRIRHADISIAPVIRLGSDGDIFKRFISYGTSSATDLEFRRRSSWSACRTSKSLYYGFGAWESSPSKPSLRLSAWRIRYAYLSYWYARDNALYLNKRSVCNTHFAQ
jgi:hypothetical protein